MFDVMQLSLDVMQRLVTDYRLAGYPADLYVTVPKTSARVLDFHKASDLIALGRELTIAALDEAGHGAMRLRTDPRSFRARYPDAPSTQDRPAATPTGRTTHA